MFACLLLNWCCATVPPVASVILVFYRCTLLIGNTRSVTTKPEGRAQLRPFQWRVPFRRRHVEPRGGGPLLRGALPQPERLQAHCRGHSRQVEPGMCGVLLRVEELVPRGEPEPERHHQHLAGGAGLRAYHLGV